MNDKKKWGKGKKIGVITSSSLGGLILIGIFIMYGPISYFRDLWITSAMTTMNHQYLATMLYSKKTIDKVMNKNNVISLEDISNLDEINIYDGKFNGIYESEYDKEVLIKDKDNDLYKIIEIKGKLYKGFVVAIYDPSRVRLALTPKLGVYGEQLDKIIEKSNGLLGINAGGFHDPEHSKGETPDGVIINDGKIAWGKTFNGIRNFIGLTYDNKLFLGRVTKEEALNKNVRDAIEFSPYLIINGKPAIVNGNGGWGIASRTGIGQRKDGIILFLVIDGRKPGHSIGAGMGDMIEIFQRYGAYNAANLDGGASSALVVNGVVTNKPTNSTANGLKGLPNAFIVTKE